MQKNVSENNVVEIIGDFAIDAAPLLLLLLLLLLALLLALILFIVIIVRLIVALLLHLLSLQRQLQF